MSTFTRNTKVILNTNSNSVYLGEAEVENVLTVSGSTIVRGSDIYAGNRGIPLPDGTIANFAAYTAGSAPTDRLAIYRGSGTTTRIATMVRATGGGKTAGSLYSGDSVEDSDYLGVESGVSDGGGAAAAAYLLLLQPKWGNPSGFAKKYSNSIIKS
mgnify:FL=1